MSKAQQRFIDHIASNQLEKCSVRGCDRLRQAQGLHCMAHKLRKLKYGHTEARYLEYFVYEHERLIMEKLFPLNQDHVGYKAIQVYFLSSIERSIKANFKWANIWRRCSVDSVDKMITRIAGLWLYYYTQVNEKEGSIKGVEHLNALAAGVIMNEAKIGQKAKIKDRRDFGRVINKFTGAFFLFAIKAALRMENWSRD